jgi:filamentous hemagglutinin
MDLIGSAISNKDDINLQANKINLSTALTSQKNINIVSKVNDLILDKAITAQGDINVSALAGSINANSLNAVSSQGKLSVLAQKDINLISLQETTPTPSADKDKVTTKQAILKAEKGITIGSLGEGKLALKAVELTANQGTIQLLGKNGVNLEGNEDIYITEDTGRSQTVKNKLSATNILIEKKSRRQP